MAGADKRLQRRREFRQHLFLYALVNGALWVAWIGVGLVDGFGFLFPIFPTVLWGVALLIHGVIAYRPGGTPEAPTESDPRRSDA